VTFQRPLLSSQDTYSSAVFRTLHSKPLDFYCSSSAILTEQQIGHKEGHVCRRLENTQERTDRFRSSYEVTYCAKPMLYLLLPNIYSLCLHCSGIPWRNCLHPPKIPPTLFFRRSFTACEVIARYLKISTSFLSGFIWCWEDSEKGISSPIFQQLNTVWY